LNFNSQKGAHKATRPGIYLTPTEFVVGLLIVVVDDRIEVLAEKLAVTPDPNAPNFSPLTITTKAPFPKVPRGTLVVKGCKTVMHAWVGSYRLYTSMLMMLSMMEALVAVFKIWHGSGSQPDITASTWMGYSLLTIK